MENLTRLNSIDPEMESKRLAIERFIQKEKESITYPEGKIELALVFHVLYNNIEEQISEEKILLQVDALNEHFNNKASFGDHPAFVDGKYYNLIGVPALQFCIAVDEGQTPGLKGINYKKVESSSWSMNDQMKSTVSDGLNPREVRKFINVWVVNLSEDVSGYAQMPGGPETTDGIVIDYSFIGDINTSDSPYNQGKTLTHLIANYLNLYPLWSTGLCHDDYVEDTPIHNGPNYGCRPYRELSTCYNNSQTEMTMNYMDNSDDGCQFMFTIGQVNRMYASLIEGGSRYSLVNAGSICNESLLAGKREDETNRDPVVQNEIIITPNPATHLVHVQFDGFSKMQTVQMEVYDLQQRQIYKREIQIDETYSSDVDIRKWSSGIYLFRFISEAKEIYVKRIVVVN